MNYSASLPTILVFAAFVGAVLVLSFYLGAKAKTAGGYFAAHGSVHWFVNGVAFAGDYLSAASFLGICGMIASSGYDGFLYSIGYLAGWVVALFVIAEPIKRLGRFTFADALDAKFDSRGIKLAAAISTLVVSVFYLIPQMVGAGTLVRPLLGLPHYAGVLTVGVVVILIVSTAGMVSTTWVQFIKGSMLVVFCALLTVAILARGLTARPDAFAELPAGEVAAGGTVVEATGGWKDKPYVRIREGDKLKIWRKVDARGSRLADTQYLEVRDDGTRIVNGVKGGYFSPIGTIRALPGDASSTGPIGPVEFFRTLQVSTIDLWKTEKVVDGGAETTIYYPVPTKGNDILYPGTTTEFAGIRGDDPLKKLNFLSLMLALFCGTAALPHILIRYYTVKDQASARKSTVVGIATIGFFYVLTLYLGLGAMTGGTLDPTNNNMSAPLLAKSFGELPFAIVSAIAFTTVLGTVSGLIMAASGAVAHDLMERYFQIVWTDAAKVRAGKMAAVAVGGVAMVLGILFERMNVSFLVGWAFNIAASANLPAIIMLLFWGRTTKEGITASILVGMFSSLGWVLLSGPAYENVYGLDPKGALAPFSQPAIVTIPLAFAVLVGVSLMTRRKNLTTDNTDEHG
jgi:cation/acetate symporter